MKDAVFPPHAHSAGIHKSCETCRDVLEMVALDLQDTARYIKSKHMPPRPSVLKVIEAARELAEAWNAAR